MKERLVKERWMVKNRSADFASICTKFGVSGVAARLMVNRGLTEEGEIEAYLHPSLSSLHPAALLKDAEKAADILAARLAERKKIRIIGDYDVDGVTAVYILLTALRECSREGADELVSYAIPDRVRDGYGINDRLVEEAIADGVDTILTCDNGIAAPEQTAAAKAHGLTVLITDHHELQEILPDADAIVNPKQPDCTYPYKGLCGAAIAFKLAGLLYQRRFGDERRAEKLLPFAAVATVCDVMELTGENRAIVSLGLAMLRSAENPGIRALMKVNGISPEQLSAYHLGFVLGPCLNATGRLSEAVRGVQLLQADDEEEAERLAQELKSLNDLRKQMTVQGVEESIRQVEEGMLEDMVLVVFLPECHESLAGIVAGRLRERYNRPTLVITRSEDGLKGSGRSVEGYSMFEKLTECKDLLSRYGGHPMAAGFSLPEENLPVLRRQLNERCGLTEEDLTLKISIDAVLALSGLSEELVNELKLLEPFGRANEKPVFAERGLLVRRMTPIGKQRRMFRFLVEDAYGRQLDAVYFGDAEEMEQELLASFGEEEIRKMYQGRGSSARMSVIYYPTVNEFGGRRTLEIVIQRYQLCTQ